MRLKWEDFILTLSLGSFQLRHHMIVTHGKHKYSFVPHSHATWHFSFVEFLSFWVLLIPFFLNFIQPLLSIVSLCVRDAFNFQLTDKEELLAICTHIIQYFVSINIAFLGVLTFIILLALNSWRLDHLDIIYCLPYSPFHGSFSVTP